MTAAPIKKVVIAGRDAAAWLSANALLKAFQASGLKVEVVELPTLLRVQDVVASQPALEAFHRLLGFDEHEVLKATAGIYSLGQSFANFSGAAPAFLHPYGSHGASLGKVAFHQVWVKARQAGMNVAFEDFSLVAVAAKQGKFFAADSDISSFARCDYAYHLNAAAYVRYLKAHALRRGAVVTTARHLGVERDAQTGHIQALTLGDGRRVEGDLFIDATGADSLLLGGALETPVDSWAHWFPADRLLAVAGERLRSLPSFSQVRAVQGGCLHVTPTQDMLGLVYAYGGRDMSDDEAFQAVAVTAGTRVAPDATVTPLSPGRRTSAWVGNCVAVGEAACVFDPIDNVGLHSLQMGLAHLITLFPLDSDCAVEAKDYNRVIRSSLERLRDFQITHFKLNKVPGSRRWDMLRDMAVPEMLDYKIEQFKARGTVVLYDDETFQSDDWLSVFIGHGCIPRVYDPLVDLTDQDAAIRHVQQILGFIRQKVEDMSSHDAYIEMFASRDFA